METPSSSNQIVTDSGIFEAPFGEGVFAEGTEVIIEISKDIEKPLLPSILNALEIWRGYIHGGAIKE